MICIPAIDLLGGQCVRLTQGDYGRQTTYSTDPVAVAKSYEDAGITHLHLVDLDGARGTGIVNLGVLERIASQTGLIIDFGGGIKSDQAVRSAFDAGAAAITAGSIAATSPSTVEGWLQTFGPKRILLGADARDRRIATQGWIEDSGLDVVTYVQDYERRGVQRVICTDIAKDGMLAGPSTELYRELLENTGVELVASGGIRDLSDLKSLKALGCTAAIVGKALYEGTLTLKELAEL